MVLNVILVVWVIPVIIVAVAAVIGAVCIIKKPNKSEFDKKVEGKKSIKICALGKHYTGKTRWYKYIKEGKLPPKDKEETPIKVPYSEFSFSLQNGKEIHIAGGFDYSGDRNNRRLVYQKAVDENDLILYFINLNEYINNEENRKDVNSGLELVIEREKESKLIYLALTHGDEACEGDYKKSEKEFLKLMGDRCNQNPVFDSHRKTLMQNYAILSTFKEEDMKKFKEEIFDNYLAKLK